MIYLDRTSTPQPDQPEPGPAPTVDQGQPPQPTVHYPVEALTGAEVRFDASQSRPGSSPIASYEWSFGDGATGSGGVATHVYSAAGTYQVTVVVTAEDGLASTGGPVEIVIKDPQALTATPEVPPTPPDSSGLPVPVINYPVEGTVGVEVTFDGSESQPGSSPIVSYTWGFGDGTTGVGAIATHVYTAPNTYQVTLTVVNEEGLSNIGGPVQILIKDDGEAQPTAPPGQLPQPVMIFPSEGKVGNGLTFDGSQSKPGGSPIASYEWDFGDGTTGSGAVVIHFFSTPGTYQVTLMITDEDGLGNTGGPNPITITE
jgi:PKD repeat protein